MDEESSQMEIEATPLATNNQDQNSARLKPNEEILNELSSNQMEEDAKGLSMEKIKEESEVDPFERLKTAENSRPNESSPASFEEEKNNIFQNEISDEPEPPSSFQCQKCPSSIQSQNSNLNEIVLRQLEGPNGCPVFSIKENGGKIGRHSGNDVVILEESVSRFHSVISLHENKFFLEDVGSSTGTYLKVQQPLRLKKEMLIEVGSYQFQVMSVLASLERPQESQLILKVSDGPDAEIDRQIRIGESAKIGRRKTNQLCFQEDVHMSNMHAQINLVNGTYILEDMASTNG